MSTVIDLKAEQHPQIIAMAAERESSNAKFWQLHSQWRALETAWEALDGETKEEWDHNAEQVHGAFEAMMMQGVFSPAAVAAKIEACDNVIDRDLPEPAKSVQRMLQWDLERCEKALWVVHPNV